MRFAYADPPYLGLCRIYQHNHGDDGRCWDEPETHRLLIERLSDEFDGWALSLHSPGLRTILPMCPDDVRVMAWCKSFGAIKRGINPAYAWEPIIVRGGRKYATVTKTREGGVPLLFDFLVAPITLRRGFTGAKPERVVWWLLAALNVKADDEFVDLFHGSGAVTKAWEAWRNQAQLGLTG